MSWWIVIFWVLFGLLIFLWAFFSFIFILKRKLRKDDYAIKNKFNYLKNNPIGSNLKSIETLVKNNNSLQPILDFLKMSNANYIQQIDKLKLQIQNNSKSLKSYNLFSTWKRIKQAKENIVILEQEQQNFKEFTLNTEEYNNYVTKISIDLFELISKINSFFNESKLNFSYSELEEYQKTMKLIDEKNAEINRELNFINSSNIHKLFIKQILLIKNLIKLLFELFDTEKHIIALSSIIKMIDDILSENKLSNENTSRAATAIKRAKIIQEDLTNKVVKTLDFRVINKTFIREIEQLENLKLDLEKDILFINLFDKHFEPFKESIAIFYRILKDNCIKDVYKSILENFRDDREIFNLTQENIKLVNNINYEIGNFYNLISKKDKNAYLLIELMYKIANLIIKFKNENDNLYKIATKKYGDFLVLSLKLSDLDVKLFHISKLAKKLCSSSDELLKRIDDNHEIIAKIFDEMQEGFSGKNEIIDSKIKSIEDFIYVSLDLIRTDWLLMEINKRLKLYANRYHSSDNKAILASIDKLVEHNQFETAANKYIEFINKNKKMKRAS